MVRRLVSDGYRIFYDDKIAILVINSQTPMESPSRTPITCGWIAAVTNFQEKINFKSQRTADSSLSTLSVLELAGTWQSENYFPCQGSP